MARVLDASPGGRHRSHAPQSIRANVVAFASLLEISANQARIANRGGKRKSVGQGADLPLKKRIQRRGSRALNSTSSRSRPARGSRRGRGGASSVNADAEPGVIDAASGKTPLGRLAARRARSCSRARSVSRTPCFLRPVAEIVADGDDPRVRHVTSRPTTLVTRTTDSCGACGPLGRRKQRRFPASTTETDDAARLRIRIGSRAAEGSRRNASPVTLSTNRSLCSDGPVSRTSKSARGRSGKYARARSGCPAWPARALGEASTPRVRRPTSLPNEPRRRSPGRLVPTPHRAPPARTGDA